MVLSGDDDPTAIGKEHVKLQPGGRVVLRHSRSGVEFLVRRKFIRREHSAFVAAEAPTGSRSRSTFRALVRRFQRATPHFAATGSPMPKPR